MHGRIPNLPPDWPSASRIATLWAVASAVESREVTNGRLRQFLELPAHVPITKGLLLESMTWEEYWTIVTDYAARACAPERMDADT
jgi:hypothetical protein